MNLEGLTIDRYVLEQLLGHGGMGDVYLAQDTAIPRQVAIKVIHSEISPYPNSESSRNSADLSRREMKAIAQLDHPHILPLYDYGEKIVNGAPLAYMVMPYREEGSLAQWLHQRTTTALLSSEDTLFLMHQAADALQHAHGQGIVHQDVKPSNFLIHQRSSAPGQPDLFLADFGIAKFIASPSATSHTIRGTPTYMAPEQWQGKSVPETDQYALAVMTYELLTGQTPFQGGMAQMMYQHLNVTPVAPSQINTDLSPFLDAVLLKALEKKTEERFPSITSFIEALKQALEGVDPQPFIQNASTLLPPVQPTYAASLEIDNANNLDEVRLPNVPLASMSESEDEENIATQLSERSKDLPTIISAKRPVVQPSDTLHAQNHPLTYPSLPLPAPGPRNTGSLPVYPYKRTIALLVVIAILVIVFGSAGILVNASQAKNDRSFTASTTTSMQNSVSANQENITSTAQAIVQQKMKNDVTSIATIHAHQTGRAQNTVQATATVQAQNNVNTSPTVVVIIATPTLPPAIPTLTPIPTLRPTPTPTPVPAPAPTITTDCAHLVTPWVALYQYSQFGGRELCFEGKGLVNLADYGFDKQTDSINIAANGSFYDQANAQGAGLGFYYSDEQADLGTWDNRISSFFVTG